MASPLNDDDTTSNHSFFTCGGCGKLFLRAKIYPFCLCCRRVCGKCRTKGMVMAHHGERDSNRFVGRIRDPCLERYGTVRDTDPEERLVTFEPTCGKHEWFCRNQVWNLRSLKVRELVTLYPMQEDSAPSFITCAGLGVDFDDAENDSVREDRKTEGWSLGLTRTMKCGLACAGIAISVGVAVWLVSGQRPRQR